MSVGCMQLERYADLTRTMLELLADGELHDREEVISAGLQKVPRPFARRTYIRDVANHYHSAPNAKLVDPAYSGARRIAVLALRDVARSRPWLYEMKRAGKGRTVQMTKRGLMAWASAQERLKRIQEVEAAKAV